MSTLESAEVREISYTKDRPHLNHLLDSTDLAFSESLKTVLDTEKAFSYVAAVGESLVGVAIVHTDFEASYGWVQDEDTEMLQSGTNAYLEIIKVSEIWREMGIGSLLLNEITEKLRKLHKKKLWLHVASSNQIALQFYARRDWVRVKEVCPDWRDGEKMFLYSRFVAC